MNSFIGWIGGKKLLRNEIIKRFPSNIGRYIEVCGGAAWVLFHKERHAEIEIYNDANGDLVNLFRCIKHHYLEMQRELSFVLNSRETFEEFKSQYNVKGMTDIQRAARFFLLLKTSYGSNGRSYGCVKKDISVMSEYLTQIHNRLASVIIENKDFEDLMKVYDKPDALSYFDPPYYKTEKYYQAEFSKEDHLRLKEVLCALKGRFLLSYNDCEFIRNLYSNFVIEELNRSHNLVGRYSEKEHNFKELLIRNY